MLGPQDLITEVLGFLGLGCFHLVLAMSQPPRAEDSEISAVEMEMYKAFEVKAHPPAGLAWSEVQTKQSVLTRSLGLQIAQEQVPFICLRLQQQVFLLHLEPLSS